MKKQFGRFFNFKTIVFLCQNFLPLNLHDFKKIMMFLIHNYPIIIITFTRCKDGFRFFSWHGLEKNYITCIWLAYHYTSTYNLQNSAKFTIRKGNLLGWLDFCCVQTQSLSIHLLFPPPHLTLSKQHLQKKKFTLHVLHV